MKSFKTITVFEPNRTECPSEVYDQVRYLWAVKELGNDTSYYPWDKEYDSEQFPLIAAYLEECGYGDADIYIHWWW